MTACRHCRDAVIWDAALECWEHHRSGPVRWRCAGTERLAAPAHAALTPVAVASVDHHHGVDHPRTGGIASHADQHVPQVQP